MTTQTLLQEQRDEFYKKFEVLELDPEIRGIGDDILNWHTQSIKQILQAEVERLKESLPQIKSIYDMEKPISDEDMKHLASAPFDLGRLDAITDQINRLTYIIEML